MNRLINFHSFYQYNIILYITCLQRFGGNVNHDPHMLYTLSALQILLLCGEIDKIDKEKVGSFIASLQKPDGSFMGDVWGEVDTRFSYCALSSLSILGLLNSGLIDVPKAVDFIARSG